MHETVRRLRSVYVLSFLKKAVERLERRPLRAPTLAVWLRAVLLHHATQLMAIANTGNTSAAASQAEALTCLHRTLDARLRSFKPMLKLCGRLDLVMSQVALMQHAHGDGDEGNRAFHEVIEGEDDGDDNDEQAEIEDESERDIDHDDNDKDGNEDKDEDEDEDEDDNNDDDDDDNDDNSDIDDSDGDAEEGGEDSDSEEHD